MPSHSDVAKRIFDDAKEHTSQHQDSEQWDLLNGLSELCLAVESLEVEVGELKNQMSDVTARALDLSDRQKLPTLTRIQ